MRIGKRLAERSNKATASKTLQPRSISGLHGELAFHRWTLPIEGTERRVTPKNLLRLVFTR